VATSLLVEVLPDQQYLFDPTCLPVLKNLQFIRIIALRRSRPVEHPVSVSGTRPGKVFLASRQSLFLFDQRSNAEPEPVRFYKRGAEKNGHATDMSRRGLFMLLDAEDLRLIPQLNHPERQARRQLALSRR